MFKYFNDTGLPLLRRLQLLSLIYLLLAFYLRELVGRQRPGLQRLVLSLPILLANFAAFTIFEPYYEAVPRTAALFILTWLCSSKVNYFYAEHSNLIENVAWLMLWGLQTIAFCLNRGSLAAPHSMAQFSALMLLPIFPSQSQGGAKALQGRLHDTAGGPAILLLRFASKIALLGGVVHALMMPQLQHVVKHFVYALGLYAFVGILMDGPASIVTALIGMDIVPTFDQPWLSTTFADFWGRRWNVTTSSVLRTLVYDVVVDGCFVKPKVKPLKPSALRRAIGVMATFVASSIAHEFILWAVMGDGIWRWKWTVFFGIQGPLMVGEALLVKWAAKARVLPNPWVMRLVTLALLEVVAYFFFFPPVETDTDLADRFVNEVKQSYWALLANLPHFATYKTSDAV